MASCLLDQDGGGKGCVPATSCGARKATQEEVWLDGRAGGGSVACNGKGVEVWWILDSIWVATARGLVDGLSGEG